MIYTPSIKAKGLLKAALFAVLGFVSLALTVDEIPLRSLFDDRVEIKVPEKFYELPEEMLKLKYPSERRPSLVYSNEKTTINLAFNLTESPANDEAMAIYTGKLVEVMKNVYPSAEWIGDGTVEINDRQVGFLEMITPAIDVEIYNLMFFTHLEGKMLMCSFNCTKPEMVEWKPTSHEIMESLKIND